MAAVGADLIVIVIVTIHVHLVRAALLLLLDFFLFGHFLRRHRQFLGRLDRFLGRLAGRGTKQAPDFRFLLAALLFLGVGHAKLADRVVIVAIRHLRWRRRERLDRFANL